MVHTFAQMPLYQNYPRGRSGQLPYLQDVWPHGPVHEVHDVQEGGNPEDVWHGHGFQAPGEVSPQLPGWRGCQCAGGEGQVRGSTGLLHDPDARQDDRRHDWPVCQEGHQGRALRKDSLGYLLTYSLSILTFQILKKKFESHQINWTPF